MKITKKDIPNITDTIEAMKVGEKTMQRISDTNRRATAVIKELYHQDFSVKAIYDAMEDGGYLKSEGISQEVAEEVHDRLGAGRYKMKH